VARWPRSGEKRLLAKTKTRVKKRAKRGKGGGEGIFQHLKKRTGGQVIGELDSTPGSVRTEVNRRGP